MHNEIKIHLSTIRSFSNIEVPAYKMSRIEATYEAVIMFIKWYNNQK